VSELPTGTVTFLFTDVEGSTRLLQALGDAYGEVLADHHRLLREAFVPHGGHEIDTQAIRSSSRSAGRRTLSQRRSTPSVRLWLTRGQRAVRCGCGWGCIRVSRSSARNATSVWGCTGRRASQPPGTVDRSCSRTPPTSWLLLGDAGTRLGVGSGPEPWLSVLPGYAELQRDEVTHTAEYLSGGVPDRRIATFSALYEAMLCAELTARGIPETLQHDDLHGNNVYPHSGTTRILDWGDSCVSHPFVTLYVTFLHLEKLGGLARGDPWFVRLRDAYLEPWGRPAELRETFELAQRLGAFAYVFKQFHVVDAIPELERRFVPDLPDALARCVELTA
jgi:class 3 adenylate cyclase